MEGLGEGADVYGGGGGGEADARAGDCEGGEARDEGLAVDDVFGEAVCGVCLGVEGYGRREGGGGEGDGAGADDDLCGGRGKADRGAGDCYCWAAGGEGLAVDDVFG